MIIIGVNAYHGDSAACLLRDGVLVAAAEEERFRRIKHWAGFPIEAIKYCLKEAGAELSDIDYVAVNSDPKANLTRKLLYAVSRRPSPRLILERIRNAGKRVALREELESVSPGCGFRGEIRHIEHHRAHLSSAFHVSPFDESAVVSVDGFGDFSSAAWGLGAGNRITIDGRVYFPHSLGAFYQAMTQFIGFPNYGDEYKMMGLAPYGKPEYLDKMRQIVRLTNDGGFRLNMDYFVYHKETVNYEWEGTSPTVGRLFSAALDDLLGPRRAKDDELEQHHMNIARSVQAMYEEAFFHILESLHDRHKTRAVCLAGGCAMNSVANGKVARHTPFEKVYIQSAAGDAGGAIGAAFSAYHEMSGSSRRFHMDHSYWGACFSDRDIKEDIDVVADELQEARCKIDYIDDEQQLCDRTARAIAEGSVVGWFQGRMEWGPRALGNRSILGDPRRGDMKDILNRKIKRRESFRPFAPSILREEVPEWFEQDDDVPFMMKVFQIRPEQRERIPAVTHVDGSGRLQTVYGETNARYYRLIKAFQALTGVPVVLNTSFNENEPVVCKPSEAIDCFLRTRMDVLVAGNWYLHREQ